MRAQRDYMPEIGRLATIRHRVEADLRHCPCEGTRQRILLAVSEIIANVLRHSAPAANDIQVDFVSHNGRSYAVIRDDGGVFTDFQDKWRQAAAREKVDLFRQPHLGLPLVRRLWPQAFYIPRQGSARYNLFVLPLTEQGASALPDYFQAAQNDWSALIEPLGRRRTAR